MRMSFLSLSTTARSLLITASGSGATGLPPVSIIRLPPLPQYSPVRSFRAKLLGFMAEKGREEEGLSKSSVKFSPSVHKMQDVTKSDPTGGWEKCWEDGLTPWDLGQPTPIVEHLNRKGILPKGRALVPGCGSGHDVVALACPERYVIGLDISEVAIRKAEQLSSSSPNANYFSFLKEDFFSWNPSELFDLILDYTFFCAIEPSMRPAWGARIRELLKPDGELVTLMFPIDDHIGGPPFKTSVADYEKVLCPLGFQAVSIEDNEHAVGPRKGREKLGRWKKTGGLSSL